MAKQMRNIIPLPEIHRILLIEFTLATGLEVFAQVLFLSPKR